MATRSFFAYLQSVGWKVWTISALTVAAILVFCGWPLGLLILAVAFLALIPAVKLGMQAEAEKHLRAKEDKVS
ncbi:MAG: hypothetical protein EON58_02425 [Alphaproteobacteria bacterium]|nr:MAG: hypothetical protein EON58_02425 [Alphaproteobacteria bacterium]